ncbi:MAG: sulfatase [Planctomycetes bacterium]|nr:sulfatase [Planctomycetota bacterium]
MLTKYTFTFRYLTTLLLVIALGSGRALCLADEGGLADEEAKADTEQPNIVIIFMDDMGYADIGPFGAKGYQTPHLERMAQEGRKFTDFHAATAVCSASRAALLTGCYPERVSILGALGPSATHGLHPSEITLAELCQQRGYATAIFGKWHLGHHRPFLPLQHGFDEYFGLPYSNDMWPHHPAVAHLPMVERLKRWPHLPLIEGNEIIHAEMTGEDQAQLTTQYTHRAVQFIEQNKDRPFFLYVPHSMVHVPLYVSEKFKGKSEQGLFGDVMMEIDWSVGQILATLDKHHLSRQTLVVFTSDNGPWLNYGDHAGSAAPLREGKGTMFEGGYREPCLMRWPGKIPAGTTCDELATTMDLLPTVAQLIDAPLPTERIIDGKDIRPLMFGDANIRSPHELFCCYYGGQLQAVRDRRWKLHFPHTFRTLAGKPGGKDGIPVDYSQGKIGVELFDLKHDVGETTNVADQHPEIVARLEKLASLARVDLGDQLTGQMGENVRPAGKLDAEINP